MPTFLDTHAWVWWVTEDRRLSRRARAAIDAAIGHDGVAISLISVWEIAKKVEKQQLVLDRPLHDWLAQAMSAAGLSVAPLTVAILTDSCTLPQPFHGDPADQIIVASVREHHARLITKDRALRQYPHVQTIW